MKKIIFTAFSFFVFSDLVSGQAALFRKIELFEVIAKADLILYGRITSAATGGKNFTVEVEKVVSGTYSEPSIEVLKFINNKYGKRWGKYVEDEKVMLFLTNLEGKFEIVGLGGEGEKLIMGNDLFLDGRSKGIFNRFDYFPLLVSGQIYAEKIPLLEITPALKDFRNCFAVTWKEETVIGYEGLQPVPYVKQTCPQNEVDRYSEINDIANQLTKQSIAHLSE